MNEENLGVEIEKPTPKNKAPMNKKLKLIIIISIAAVVVIGAVIGMYYIFRCRHLNAEWVIVTAPTCTQDGYQEYQCPDCGDVLSDSNMLATGHKWVGGECGVTARKCEVCDATEMVPAHQEGGANNTCRNCGKPGFTFIYPELPMLVNYYNSGNQVIEQIKITELAFDGNSGTITWSAEMMYHIQGNNYSDSCAFGYKIYDKDGYVVYSGSCYSSDIKVGEKFRGEVDYDYFDDKLVQWETYTIEILNLKK